LQLMRMSASALRRRLQLMRMSALALRRRTESPYWPVPLPLSRSLLSSVPWRCRRPL
jgi:hypothetical protein